MVVVREQSSTVVQVVPKDAPMLYLPRTVQRPGRRWVLTWNRRGARAASAASPAFRADPAQAGRSTVSMVVTLRRPEVWRIVAAAPDNSAEASGPFPRVAVTRTGQSATSTVGARRPRKPLASRIE